MAFKKGQSGNPGGRSTGKPFADALRMELAAAGKDHKAIREIARNLISLAQRADKEALPAIAAIADRLDGKPAQESTMTVKRVSANQLADDELADIAAGGSEDAAGTPIDPSQLN